MNLINQRRKVILDCDIEFPPSMTPEFIAGVLLDYMRMNRFINNQTVTISVYDANVKVVQNPISLVSSLPDSKH